MSDANTLAEVADAIEQRTKLIREQCTYSRQAGHATMLGFKVEQHAEAILAALRQPAEAPEPVAWTPETDLLACERAIDRMGWPEIHAFHAEPSQSPWEDAGGGILRRIKALFGIKNDRLETYREAATRLVAEARRDLPTGAQQDG